MKKVFEIQVVYSTPLERDIKVHNSQVCANDLDQATDIVKDEVITKVLNKHLPILCASYVFTTNDYNYNTIYRIVKKYITFISFVLFKDNFTTFVDEYHD